MKGKKDNDVEVIYLGVPNHLHFSMAKQALENNKHVICEKPFTSHIKELEILNAMAKEKKEKKVEKSTSRFPK